MKFSDRVRKLKLHLAKNIFGPFSRFILNNAGSDVLVLRMDDKLGDSVTSTGFLRELKKSLSGKGRLIVVAGKSSAEIFKGLDFIDEVHVYKKGVFSTLKVFFAFRNYKFRYIINTSHILNPRVVFLVSFLQAYKKISFGSFNFKCFSDHIVVDFKTEHVTRRYAKVLDLLGITGYSLDYVLKIDSEEEIRAEIYLGELRKKFSKIIILNSFAGARLRNLGEFVTKKIVNKLLENPEVAVLSIAGAGDHKLLSHWQQGADVRWISNPDFSTVQANMALVKFADLIITPDTAWVHIASALKKKLVAFYRPDDKSSSELNSVIWAPHQTYAQVFKIKEAGTLDDEILHEISEF